MLTLLSWKLVYYVPPFWSSKKIIKYYSHILVAQETIDTVIHKGKENLGSINCEHFSDDAEWYSGKAEGICQSLFGER